MRPRSFQEGDLVLRRTFEDRELKPNWEGPYQVAGPRNKGAYRLQSLDGTPEPKLWNVTHLKKILPVNE